MGIIKLFKAKQKDKLINTINLDKMQPQRT